MGSKIEDQRLGIYQMSGLFSYQPPAQTVVQSCEQGEFVTEYAPRGLRQAQPTGEYPDFTFYLTQFRS